jgi:8-oxo-dGTP diphosphatase
VTDASRRPVAAVGVVCLKGDEVLLIRRGEHPRRGEWSLPGGKLEWGERVEACALRELFEETAVKAALLGFIEVVDGLFPDPPVADDARHYVLIDYAARWVSGEPVGGDDAAEARFFSFDEMRSLGLWSETVRIVEKAAAMFPQKSGS